MYTQPDPIGLKGNNQTLYTNVNNPNWWVDPFGLNVSIGAGRTHITYESIKNGKPYTGYASMPGLGHSAEDVLNYCYSGGFDPTNPSFPDVRPDVVYHNEDVIGKKTAHGLEQHGYEQNVKQYGKDGVAKNQNPVGENNVKKDIYKVAADAELNKGKEQVICNS